MKCDQCGMHNTLADAVHCSNCGALLRPASNAGGQSPAQQPSYQQSSQQYHPQQPMAVPRVETVKNVGMTEVLFLISGFLLVCAGFGNLAALRYSYMGAQYPVLGMVALLGGLFVIGMIVMPSLVQVHAEYRGKVLLGISVLFFFWGMAALFANNVGWYGAEIVTASIAGLAGSSLKMGLIK